VAVNLSMTFMIPPQRGHFQKVRSWVALGSGFVMDARACVSSNWAHSGRSLARLRLARKPKLRMRTKPR